MLMTFSGWIFLASGALLTYYSYTRYRSYKRNRANTINYYYWVATSFISAAFFFYSLPAIIFGNQFNAIAIGASIATVLNTLGFSYFFLLAVYSFVDKLCALIITRYVFYLYAGIIALFLTIDLPLSHLDSHGIIHWGFSPAVAFLMLALQALSFSLNIVLLARYFKSLASISVINVSLLLITFFFTASGGGYQYIGDNWFLLAFTSVILFFGILTAFVTGVRVKL